jgi:hypothetical protein
MKNRAERRRQAARDRAMLKLALTPGYNGDLERCGCCGHKFRMYEWHSIGRDRLGARIRACRPCAWAHIEAFEAIVQTRPSASSESSSSSPGAVIGRQQCH